MTWAEIQHHVDQRRITWGQVVETLANAHVPAEAIAGLMGGETIVGLYAVMMLRQLISSGEVPLQPVAE